MRKGQIIASVIQRPWVLVHIYIHVVTDIFIVQCGFQSIFAYLFHLIPLLYVEISLPCFQLKKLWPGEAKRFVQNDQKNKKAELRTRFFDLRVYLEHILSCTGFSTVNKS